MVGASVAQGGRAGGTALTEPAPGRATAITAASFLRLV